MNNEMTPCNSSVCPLIPALSVATEKVSDNFMQLIDLIFNCCLTQVCSLFAFCGTAVNIAVLTSYDLSRDSSAILLLAMSLADLIFCITLPFRRCQCLVGAMMGPAQGMTVATLMTEWLSVFNRLFFCISITLVGLIASERFVAVFWPFQAQCILSPRNITSATLIAYACNVMLISPGFYMFTHDWAFFERFNQSVAVLQMSDFYLHNYDTLNFLFTIVYNTGLLGTSMLGTLIFMPAIGIKIWAVNKRRQTLVQNKEFRFDTQLAKVLSIICLVSLTFHGPGIFFDTVAYFIPNFINQSEKYEVYQILVDFSGTLSALANFLVYMTMSGKYKHRYQKLIGEMTCRLCCQSDSDFINQ
ncbi:somatostatin receptor type 5 [Biomphalaria pfeifferi]|uniref:Somatostatin receptor type 5 n=1 Tax=Biomphalaria pfeifferi TaxID=112525 RepID=A0AAD8FER5_BIOPF|nr:somatostatin receptor type 5 [Biomphalaria pfeifferi]